MITPVAETTGNCQPKLPQSSSYKGQTLLFAVVVTPGTIVSTRSWCVCVVIAHVFGWCERCVDCFPLSVRTLRLVGTVTTHPRSPAWHRRLRNRRQTARLRLRQNCATPADHWKIAIQHGSCLPGAMSQKGRRQLKQWKCVESASAGLGVGPNAGTVEVTVRWNRKDESSETLRIWRVPAKRTSQRLCGITRAC